MRASTCSSEDCALEPLQRAPHALWPVGTSLRLCHDGLLHQLAFLCPSPNSRLDPPQGACPDHFYFDFASSNTPLPPGRGLLLLIEMGVRHAGPWNLTSRVCSLGDTSAGHLGHTGVALLGPLGVGPLSWLNRRKSIRRPDRKNDTSRPGSRSPCNHPNCHVAASAFVGQNASGHHCLPALHRDLVWTARCQEPQQASRGRLACLHCSELLL